MSFEGDERRDDGQQLRLDREPLDHRLPARHRQALPGQPDAGPRRRAHPARERHQLHRVQLRPAPVDGLPQPVPRPRRDAAVRRLGPVGQPHRRRRADPPRRRRARARVRDAAGHQGRRHQVRQDRGRRALARPGDDDAVRLLPVLAQRRGREGRRAAADLHVPARREEIEALEAEHAEKPFLRARSAARSPQQVTTLVHGAEATAPDRGGLGGAVQRRLARRGGHRRPACRRWRQPGRW